MLRGYSFTLFLALIPIPLIFFFPFFVFVYLMLLLAIVFFFKRILLKTVLFVLLAIIFSSFFHYRTLQNLDRNCGKVVEFYGIVIKQKNSQFNTFFSVFVPDLKLRTGRTLSLMRVYTVKTPLFYQDFRGCVLKITGILEREKVYKNPYSTNYFYLVSNNKLHYIRVKERVFLKEIARIGFLKFDKFFLSNYSDYNVKCFLNALILGQKGYLDLDFKNRIKQLGIYHLFVLSGFHFGIFYLILWALVFPLPLRKRYKKIIVILMLTILLVITSFSSPAFRVFLMIIIYLLFEIDGINIEPIDAIGIAGLIMLMLNPFNGFNPGFLMSFTASAAIVMAVKEKGILYSFFIIPFVAFFIMLPFYLKVFNYLPVLAPFYNVIIIPFIVVLFWFVMANFILNGFFSVFIEWYVLKITDFLNVLPKTGIDIYPDTIIVFLAVATVLFFFFNKRVGTFFALSVIVFLLSFGSPYLKNKEFICFFDSKQPQCALLKSKDGVVLINTGDFYFSSVFLKKELGYRGMKKIDLLVLQKINSRVLNYVELLCEQVKVKNILVAEYNTDSLTDYRLKWISKFYNLKVKKIPVNEEYNPILKNLYIGFNENCLKVKFKDKRVFFCKKCVALPHCDILVLKNFKNHCSGVNAGKIFVSDYVEDNLSKMYSLSKNGGVCLQLK